MTAKAFAVIHDNGEEVCVELPDTQELVNQVESWRNRHSACKDALAVATVCSSAGWITAVVMAAIHWGWAR